MEEAVSFNECKKPPFMGGFCFALANRVESEELRVEMT